MRREMGLLLSAGALLFAAFSSSPTYQLQSYGIGGAQSNTAASATYQLESSTGQVQSISTSSPTYATNAGSLQAQQASVPPAPTLSNGSSTYYNKLGLVINTGGNASDATYAVAVSSNNFTTTNYVQINGSLGSTPLFQTYAQWGSSSGTTIIGLATATSYEVKVSAMQGMFTNTAYGPYATSATASPSLSFSVSPGSLTLPNLLSGSVVSSSAITTDLTTNASYGATIYASDSNTGLTSASRAKTIPSVSGNLGGLSHGYGMQGTATSQTSGGPLSINSPYNGTANTVGGLNTTAQSVFSATAPIIGGTATAVLQAKAAATDSSSSDYSDTVSFIAAASF